MARLFPSSKLIWCVRDARDNMVSIFNTYFARGHLYATSFEDTAAFAALHNDALSYWQQVLGERIRVQSYEELVSNPEEQIKSLLDYCDLPMESACLNFHQRTNAVTTASMTQVRQPIYKKSVARWKRYESYIPEIENLVKKYKLGSVSS